MNEKTDIKFIVNELKEKTEINDIISEYINTNKAGKNYSALCPFHAEDTPSFYIFPETKTYHCFGCGEHGDVIKFVEKYENIDFISALKKIASKQGIKIDLEKKTLPIEIYINEEISKIYTNNILQLNRDHVCWKFLKNRGLNELNIKQYELGFSSGNEIKNILKKNKKYLEIYEKNGLIRNNKEFFYNRLIIPIRDNYGRLVGFSGRALDENIKPKYINTPENKYFKKSNILYLYYKNEKIIHQNDFVIIVEGYFDAISMNKIGFENTVAVLGSSLTKEHSITLKKTTNKIITMYDMDSAGKKATIDTIENLYNQGFQIAVAKYDEKDPDELTRKKDKNFIAEILKTSYKFHEYIAETYANKYDLNNEFGAEEYIKEMSIWYKKFSIAGRYEISLGLIKTVSQILNITEQTLKTIFERNTKNYQIKNTPYKQKEITPAQIEREIRNDLGKSFIYLWLKYPEYREIIMKFDPNIIPDKTVKQFIDFIKKDYDLSMILEEGSEELFEIVSKVWKVDYKFKPDRILSALEKTYLRLSVNREIEILRKELKNTKDENQRSLLTSKIIDLYAKIKTHGGK